MSENIFVRPQGVRIGGPRIKHLREYQTYRANWLVLLVAVFIDTVNVVPA